MKIPKNIDEFDALPLGERMEVLNLLHACQRTLKEIEIWPGNLPDSEYEKGFSNESKDRGLKIIAMRMLARGQLNEMR
jgi:hypothetical protein